MSPADIYPCSSKLTTLSPADNLVQYFTVVPSHCWYGGNRYECALSLSCAFAGAKSLDLCDGGLVWSCCVPKSEVLVDDFETYGISEHESTRHNASGQRKKTSTKGDNWVNETVIS